jgi:flagellar motor protein MotB
MSKRNYDNALTKLYEEKESLDFSILTLEGDDLYREIASVLTELSLIDRSSGKKIISESERRLIEEGFFSDLKKSWKNLWGKANKEAEKQTGEKLSKKEQQAIKYTQEEIAKMTKDCTAREQGTWDVSFAGTDTKHNEKEWMERAVKRCVEEAMRGPKGKSAIGKLGDFLRGTIAGKALVSLVAIGAMGMIVGSATGAIGSSLDTDTTTTTDGPTDVDLDQDLSNTLVDNHGAQQADLASQQGVDIQDDLPQHVGIDFDTGSADLSQDQQQKIIKTIQEIIKNIQDRIDAGHTDISVELNAQGNASNDGGNWNHNNDTGGDNLNQDRANSVEKSLEPLVKKLSDMGVKVKLTKTIGEKGSSVDAGSDMSDATETGTIGFKVDSKAKTTTTTDTTLTPGPIKNYERDFRVGPVPPLCKWVNKETGKRLPMSPGFIIGTNFELEKIDGGVKTKKDGRLFSGFIKTYSKEESGTKFGKIQVLGGFTTPKKDFKHEHLQPNSNYIVFEVIDPKMDGEWLGICDYKGKEKPFEGEPEPDKGEPDKGKTEPTPPVSPDIPKDFLEGNRNMQLAYLAKNFLPGGKSLWSGLGLKEGSKLPSGFFDAALGQGKWDTEKYLSKYYDFLVKENAFDKKINKNAWFAKVRSNKNLALIKWIRNTRKNIGSFFKKFKDDYKVGLGDRSRAFTTKAGKLGKAMGTIGDSVENRSNLINESAFNDSAKKAGFSEDLLMKNLPQFIEMLTSMYFGIKGKKLGYDKEAVMKMCKKYGCKSKGGKKFDRKVSSDYYLMDDTDKNNGVIEEEIKRIRQLMK